MVSKEKKFAGQVIREHDAKSFDLEDDIIEYRKAMEPEIMSRLYDTVAKTRMTDGYSGKDFYVVLLTTAERVLRQPKLTYLARKSCPTPVFKQSVWKYKNCSGQLEFLWSIPDSILYYHILQDPVRYLKDKETADIARFVILMEDGALLDWVKQENGEKIDAVIKITNEEGVCLKN